mgnify:CR=1 FL=1
MEKRPEGADRLRELVREGYTRVAKETDEGGGDRARDLGRRIGYSEDQLGVVPEGANLGVGCGNPTAIDALGPGETVLDLGSGAGMDAFLAARQVGPSGRVIGVIEQSSTPNTPSNRGYVTSRRTDSPLAARSSPLRSVS